MTQHIEMINTFINSAFRILIANFLFSDSYSHARLAQTSCSIGDKIKIKKPRKSICPHCCTSIRNKREKLCYSCRIKIDPEISTTLTRELGFPQVILKTLETRNRRGGYKNFSLQNIIRISISYEEKCEMEFFRRKSIERRMLGMRFLALLKNDNLLNIIQNTEKPTLFTYVISFMRGILD